MRPGFQVCAGIRQGCPLSPLLFAVSVDPILQTIQRTLQSATVRAYADDLVTVVDSLEKALPILVPLFRRFALASGLHLNFSKVVLVPLGDASPATSSSWLSTHFPTWTAVKCQYWAKYLGFVLGPEAEEKSWEKALEKAQARARLWGQLALGLQFAAVIYRVYIASTLGFLLQLEPLPASWTVAEGRLLRALVPGPYRWCSADALHILRKDFGFAQEFVDLRIVDTAAKLRVVHCEAKEQGGLRHRCKLRQIALAERQTDYVVRLARWRQWFAQSFSQRLEDAVACARQAGFSLQAAYSRAAGA